MSAVKQSESAPRRQFTLADRLDVSRMELASSRARVAQASGDDAAESIAFGDFIAALDNFKLRNSTRAAPAAEAPARREEGPFFIEPANTGGGGKTWGFYVLRLGDLGIHGWFGTEARAQEQADYLNRTALAGLAPELLAALRDAHAALRHHPNGDTRCPGASAAAARLIAKATGRP